jgi:hypothetical protein
MKYFILIAALIATSSTAKDVYVKPHVNRDGTYVEGHYRTAPNSSRHDNYGTQGNVNPYTGHQGTVNPYTQPAPTYQPYQAPQPYQPYQPYQSR